MKTIGIIGFIIGLVALLLVIREAYLMQEFRGQMLNKDPKKPLFDFTNFDWKGEDDFENGDPLGGTR